MSDPAHGRHNSDLGKSRDRLVRANTYRDASTVIVNVSRGMVPLTVVHSWMGLMAPMNQKLVRIGIENAEVGDGYNQAVDIILGNPDLSKFKFMLTLEEDNLPPPDGLLKLLESVKDFDVVGGLYWTKGEGGQPMCYGNPDTMPRNYIPWLPTPGAVARCNGLGMGFTLFRLELFQKMARPWFKTVEEFTPGVGAHAMTQDLFFFENAAKQGFRVACDTRVLVGHRDTKTGIIW